MLEEDIQRQVHATLKGLLTFYKSRIVKLCYVAALVVG